jgi:hypothetical protein
VITERAPDIRIDESPDSSKAIVLTVRAHARNSSNEHENGHLPLDQEIEGSNPSSPATPQDIVVRDAPITTSSGTSPSCTALRTLQRSTDIQTPMIRARMTTMST